jgi:hypothetical protein
MRASFIYGPLTIKAVGAETEVTRMAAAVFEAEETNPLIVAVT